MRLQDQPARILRLLLSRPGELITRDEIRRELWPDDVFVDHEHGLHRAINKLREALCDSAADPRFIETRARTGYRFIGSIPPEVEESGKTRETGIATSEPPSVASPIRKPLLARYRATLLGAAALTLGAFFLLLFSAATKKSLHIQVLPLVTLAGTQASPTISPDGNEIAFVYNPERSNNFAIYLKGLHDDNFVRITSGPGFPDDPAFSPDGQQIAYSYYLQKKPGILERSVMVMSRLGGNPHLVRQVSADADSRVGWSPDGRFLVCADQPKGEPEGIFAVSLDGSTARRLTTAPPGGEDRQPSVSQKDGQVVFVRNDGLHSSDLYMAAISGGQPMRVTSLHRWIDYPIWTSDDDSIIFAAELNSGLSESLYVVPRSGGDPQAMPFFGLDAARPSVSRNGKKFVFLKSEPVNISVWQLRIGSSESPTKLIGSTRIDESSIASPDGSKIAFVSTRDGTMALWRCDRDGSNAVRLASLGEEGGSPAWSPDSSHIAFDNWSSGHSRIQVIASNGGPAESLGTGSFNDVVPAWTSDGNSLLFASNRSGRFEIWKSGLRGQNAIQVTRNGGVWPDLSPDRRYLYYNKPRDKSFGLPLPGVWRIPVSGGEEQLVAKLPEWGWRVTGNGVYFVNHQASALEYEEFFTGKTKVLQHLNNPPLGRHVSISPDGFLFYPQRAPDKVEILLAEGGTW
jgi:Tol biopolymer transport system component/DNA-binding winged helix-turn-helix (wHTH) protein